MICYFDNFIVISGGVVNNCCDDVICNVDYFSRSFNFYCYLKWFFLVVEFSL